MQFQSTSSFWSNHVGLVSLNSSVTFSLVSWELDGRFLHVTASHSSFESAPFNIFVIYAPARASARQPFFESLALLPIFSSRVIERSVLLGDFNYQVLSRSPRGVPAIWQAHLLAYWHDCITPPSHCPSPTFLRNSSRSCIDYIFMSSDFRSFSSSPVIDFINPLWTDHHLLTAQLRLGKAPVGPGMWRCHPSLASNPLFRHALYQALDKLCASFSEGCSVQAQWDLVKKETGRVARKFNKDQRAYHNRRLWALQKERRKVLKTT
ncbi:hypothetical protein BDB00DRAFT_772823, partial [Zychaea mexicana]|uniref:uncharacterized protein n=1 Tax=Zychaea mexicana TaxID=64656 RepID=UPI0022FDB9EE